MEAHLRDAEKLKKYNTLVYKEAKEFALAHREPRLFLLVSEEFRSTALRDVCQCPLCGCKFQSESRISSCGRC